MPSSNKTGHLELNRWLGGDKPKKDDFNADNARVDEACRKMDDRLQALEEGGGSMEVLQALSAHTGNGQVHVTAAEKTALSSASTHAANASIHVTAAEKAAWNSPPAPASSMVIGSYVGNGVYTRNISVGFRPKFGILYAVDKAPVQGDFAANQLQFYAGYFGAQGNSRFLGVDSNGIVIRHTVTTPGDGLASRYNQSDVQYIYVAWPE